jgi:thioredoxin-like negative regulator of GroEL
MLKPQTTDTTGGATDGTAILTDKHSEVKDNMPVLVYFYCGDKADKRYADTDKWNKVFEASEELGRTTKLFYCVKVNAVTADQELLKKDGVKAIPCIVVTQSDGKPLSVIQGPKPSAGDVSKQLEGILKSRFVEYWASIQSKLADIAKIYDEAKALADKEDNIAALKKFQEVIDALPRSPLIDRAGEQRKNIQAKLDRVRLAELEKVFEEGKTLAAKGNYAEAVAKFKEVVDSKLAGTVVDKAKAEMKKAQDKIK